jgi:hypothetical protein
MGGVMPISNVPEDTQEVTLRRWRVIEVEARDGTRSRHVCGHDAKHASGCASSPIIEFDLDSMIATTRSGRTYRLLGLPGNSRLGKQAWNNWCRKSGVVSELDVTGEYLDIDQLSTVGFAKINSAVNQ